MSTPPLQINHANTGDIWTGVGREEGTFIWRIVKFKVSRVFQLSVVGRSGEIVVMTSIAT